MKSYLVGGSISTVHKVLLTVPTLEHRSCTMHGPLVRGPVTTLSEALITIAALEGSLLEVHRVLVAGHAVPGHFLTTHVTGKPS